jgi:DNA-binding XRE family transcriptional regulator
MNAIIEKRIGQNIKALREKNSMTQEALAAKLQLEGCDITRSAVAKIEVGQRHLYPDEIIIVKKILNVSYDDVKRLNGMISGEVARFAGPGMYTTAVVPHWGPMSKEGCKALADCGMKVMWVSNGPRYAYDGDSQALPYGHSFRLLNNRKPETALYWRGTRNTAINSSICCYNHLPTDLTEQTKGTLKSVYDKDTGISFKKFSNAPCLNLYPMDTIVPAFEKVRGKELIVFADHEQYFFKDYFAYQPDYIEKILVSSKWLKENGYEFVFIEDTVG